MSNDLTLAAALSKAFRTASSLIFSFSLQSC